MKLNALTKFLELRTTLERERAQLEHRLQQINAALGEQSASALAPKFVNGVPIQRAQRGRRRGNALSLREAVIKATTAKPLTKPEILKAIEKLGYRFAAKNPVNSLNALLYGKNPKFRNVNGKFSLATHPKSSGRAPAKLSKLRLSPAGRKRIAAAARARWKKVKAAGGKSL